MTVPQMDSYSFVLHNQYGIHSLLTFNHWHLPDKWNCDLLSFFPSHSEKQSPHGKKRKIFWSNERISTNTRFFLTKHERNERSCIFELYNIDWISSEEKLMYKTNRSHPIAEQNYFALPKGSLLITYSIS